MKLSGEKAALIEGLARRTNVEAGYACANIKRPTHVYGTYPEIISYGCGCCSSEQPLTKESLKGLIFNLEGALKSAKSLKAMYDAGELTYGEMLEADVDEDF